MLHYIFTGKIFVDADFLYGVPVSKVFKKFLKQDINYSLSEGDVIVSEQYKHFFDLYKKCVSEVRDFWREKGYSEDDFVLPAYFVPMYNRWAADSDSFDCAVDYAFLFVLDRYHVLLWTSVPFNEADDLSYRFGKVIDSD